MSQTQDTPRKATRTGKGRPQSGTRPKNSGMLITVLGLALGLLFVVGSVKELVKLRHARQELATARAEEARLAKIYEELKTREEALGDPKVIEKEAVKLGMVKRDEIPIQIIKDDPPKNGEKNGGGGESGGGGKKPTLWQRVLDFFK